MKKITKLMLNWEEYQIREFQWWWWWQPGANTIAYYPLNSTITVNDMSGNSLTLTWWWTYQFWNYGGVDCCSISSWYFTTNSSWTWNMTILAWSNYQGEPSNDTWVIAMTYSTHPVSQLWYNKKSSRPNSDPSWWIYAYAEWVSLLGYTTNYHQNANQWYLVTWVRDGSSIKLYINWALEKEKAISVWTLSYTQLGISRNTRSMVGYVSNVIFEDKLRTQQEISDYFDQTKALYWIS